jgi:hypothetical protein
MPSSIIRDAEAQYLLQHDPNDGYEMTSVNGEPSKMGEDSAPGSPSRKGSESGTDAMSQEEGLLTEDSGRVSTDPVYEAKARVLNHAVRLSSTYMTAELTFCRSKKLVWVGTNGNSLLSSDSAGQTTISGR